MSKFFWKVFISLWAAIIIAGGCTYLYIQYEQKQERKQFIAKFEYDEIIDENRPNLENYETVSHDAEEFLSSLEKSITLISSYEKKAKQLINHDEQHDDALAYMIKAYQATKNEINQYANVEITNSALVTRKKYETISIDTYNYLQAAAVYFIISAKNISSTSPQIKEQYTYAHSTMQEYYEELLKNIQAVKQN